MSKTYRDDYPELGFPYDLSSANSETVNFDFVRPSSMSKESWEAFNKGLDFGRRIERMQKDLESSDNSQTIDELNQKLNEKAMEIVDLRMSNDALLKDRNYVYDQLKREREALSVAKVTTAGSFDESKFIVFNFDVPMFGRISCIKMLRNVFGYGLKEGKEVVDAEFTRLNADFAGSITLAQLCVLMKRISANIRSYGTFTPSFADLLSDDDNG